MMFINIQRLLCTVIKFHVDKEAREAVMYFVHMDIVLWILVSFTVF